MTREEIRVLWDKIERHLQGRYELTEDELVEIQNALDALIWKL